MKHISPHDLEEPLRRIQEASYALNLISQSPDHDGDNLLIGALYGLSCTIDDQKKLIDALIWPKNNEGKVKAV